MKRLISLILSVVMMTFALYGCGTQANDAVSSQTTVNLEASSSGVSASAAINDFDWQNVFCSKPYAASPYYVVMDHCPRGYDCTMGVMSSVLQDPSVILTVVSCEKDLAEDFDVDLDAIKSIKDILPGMESVFCQNMEFGSIADIFVLTDEQEPYITIESTSEEEVQAQSKTYDVCKSEGTFHYMTIELGTTEDEYEATIQFVAYATFLSDGSPFYCAVIDASEDQSAGDACGNYALQLMQGLNEVPADFFN